MGAGLGAAGVGGVTGGIISGAAGGALGTVAAQGTAVGLGWQDSIDWTAVGAGATVGGLAGGLVFRTVPRTGPVTGTHWGPPGEWVQTGGNNFWNHLLAGRPKGTAQTITVDGSELVSPGMNEFGKGLVGQRILKDFAGRLK